MSVGVSSIVFEHNDTVNSMNSIRVADWTAEWAIIASNVSPVIPLNLLKTLRIHTDALMNRFGFKGVSWILRTERVAIIKVW